MLKRGTVLKIFTSFMHTTDHVPETREDNQAAKLPQKKNRRVHPYFLDVLYHLKTELCPLVSIDTGEFATNFPRTLLEYHLLTHQQLDELATHFHQVHPPMPQTKWYPKQVPAWVGTPEARTLSLETKRRRFGRFIGLQGCESPTRESQSWN